MNARKWIFLLFLGCILLLAGLYHIQASAAVRRETVQTSVMREEKKIALTFDDDVIIGLSQEISYKEAVSMI